MFLGVACLAVLRMTAVTQGAHLRWSEVCGSVGLALICAMVNYMRIVRILIDVCFFPMQIEGTEASMIVVIVGCQLM